MAHWNDQLAMSKLPPSKLRKSSVILAYRIQGAVAVVVVAFLVAFAYKLIK